MEVSEPAHDEVHQTSSNNSFNPTKLITDNEEPPCAQINIQACVPSSLEVDFTNPKASTKMENNSSQIMKQIKILENKDCVPPRNNPVENIGSENDFDILNQTENVDITENGSCSNFYSEKGQNLDNFQLLKHNTEFSVGCLNEKIIRQKLNIKESQHIHYGDTVVNIAEEMVTDKKKGSVIKNRNCASPRHGMTPSMLRSGFDVTPSMLRSECDLTPSMLRSDSDVMPSMLRSGCDGTPSMLRSDCNTIPNMLRSGCDVTPSMLRSECDMTPSMLISECDMTPSMLRSECKMTPNLLTSGYEMAPSMLRIDLDIYQNILTPNSHTEKRPDKICLGKTNQNEDSLTRNYQKISRQSSDCYAEDKKTKAANFIPLPPVSKKRKLPYRLSSSQPQIKKFRPPLINMSNESTHNKYLVPYIDKTINVSNGSTCTLKNEDVLEVHKNVPRTYETEMILLCSSTEIKDNIEIINKDQDTDIAISQKLVKNKTDEKNRIGEQNQCFALHHFEESISQKSLLQDVIKINEEVTLTKPQLAAQANAQVDDISNGNILKYQVRDDNQQNQKEGGTCGDQQLLFPTSEIKQDGTNLDINVNFLEDGNDLIQQTFEIVSTLQVGDTKSNKNFTEHSESQAEVDNSFCATSQNYAANCSVANVESCSPNKVKNAEEEEYFTGTHNNTLNVGKPYFEMLANKHKQSYMSYENNIEKKEYISMEETNNDKELHLTNTQEFTTNEQNVRSDNIMTGEETQNTESKLSSGIALYVEEHHLNDTNNDNIALNLFNMDREKYNNSIKIGNSSNSIHDTINENIPSGKQPQKQTRDDIKSRILNMEDHDNEKTTISDSNYSKINLSNTRKMKETITADILALPNKNEETVSYNSFNNSLGINIEIHTQEFAPGDNKGVNKTTKQDEQNTDIKTLEKPLQAFQHIENIIQSDMPTECASRKLWGYVNNDNKVGDYLDSGKNSGNHVGNGNIVGNCENSDNNFGDYVDNGNNDGGYVNNGNNIGDYADNGNIVGNDVNNGNKVGDYVDNGSNDRDYVNNGTNKLHTLPRLGDKGNIVLSLNIITCASLNQNVRIRELQESGGNTLHQSTQDIPVHSDADALTSTVIEKNSEKWVKSVTRKETSLTSTYTLVGKDYNDPSSEVNNIYMSPSTSKNSSSVKDNSELSHSYNPPTTNVIIPNDGAEPVCHNFNHLLRSDLNVKHIESSCSFSDFYRSEEMPKSLTNHFVCGFNGAAQIVPCCLASNILQGTNLSTQDIPATSGISPALPAQSNMLNTEKSSLQQNHPTSDSATDLSDSQIFQLATEDFDNQFLSSLPKINNSEDEDIEYCKRSFTSAQNKAAKEIEKSKLEGQKLVDSIMENLVSFNKQLMKMKREMEVVKRAVQQKNNQRNTNNNDSGRRFGQCSYSTIRNAWES